MRDYFIKGRRVKPGLTVATRWRTYVVTNEYKLHYVGSGNHAEVHVIKEELRSIKQYFFMRPLYALADAVSKAGKAIDRQLRKIE